jgi:hypothetical protein
MLQSDGIRLKKVMPPSTYSIFLAVSRRIKSKYLNKYEETEYQEDICKVSYVSRTYHERDEDWMVTCPECNGAGTIGTGDSRKRCSRCEGSGRIKR